MAAVAKKLFLRFSGADVGTGSALCPSTGAARRRWYLGGDMTSHAVHQNREVEQLAWPHQSASKEREKNWTSWKYELVAYSRNVGVIDGVGAVNMVLRTASTFVNLTDWWLLVSHFFSLSSGYARKSDKSRTCSFYSKYVRNTLNNATKKKLLMRLLKIRNFHWMKCMRPWTKYKKLEVLIYFFWYGFSFFFYHLQFSWI